MVRRVRCWRVRSALTQQVSVIEAVKAMCMPQRIDVTDRDSLLSKPGVSVDRHRAPAPGSTGGRPCIAPTPGCVCAAIP